MFADVAAGVDINRYQGLGVLDGNISAGFQPDLAFESSGNIAFQIVSVKNRFGAVIEHHVIL